MHTVSASATRRTLPFTQRQLYFFLLWLPMLVHVQYIYFSAVFHVPFAIVHTWNARKQSTFRLFNDSWMVPFKVAAFGVFVAIGIQIYDLAAGAKLLLAELFKGSLLCAAIGFGAAFPAVCFGWLLLITVARRWPRDRADAASP